MVNMRVGISTPYYLDFPASFSSQQRNWNEKFCKTSPPRKEKENPADTDQQNVNHVTYRISLTILNINGNIWGNLTAFRLQEVQITEVTKIQHFASNL